MLVSHLHRAVTNTYDKLKLPEKSYLMEPNMRGYLFHYFKIMSYTEVFNALTLRSLDFSQLGVM